MELKEKEYTDFNIMFREMQDCLLENEGTIISCQTVNFGITKQVWFHVETKQMFSIKTRDLIKTNLFNVLQTYDGVNELTKFINDIEKLKQADAVGNVKC